MRLGERSLVGWRRLVKGVAGLRSPSPVRRGMSAALVEVDYSREFPGCSRLGRRAARTACLLAGDLRGVLLVEAVRCRVRIVRFLPLGGRRNSLGRVIGRALFVCVRSLGG